MALLVAGFVFSTQALQLAHDVPGDITVQAFVVPEGERLRLLVRVPLEAMRDFVFPERGPGYLDIAAADSMLRDAIRVWVGDELELYEDGRRLTDQQLRAVRVSLPSSRAFASYDEALSHVTGPPLSPDMEIVWEQAMLDALFEYRIRSDQAEFSINPRWDGLAFGPSRCCGSCCRRNRPGVRVLPGIRGWFDSTHAGIRPHCGSWP